MGLLFFENRMRPLIFIALCFLNCSATVNGAAPNLNGGTAKNLMAEPVLIRHGFKLDWTKQWSLSTDWVSIPGNRFNRPVLVADIPDLPGPKPNRIKWPIDSLVHYTVNSKFQISNLDAQSEGSWGLLVGGFLGCWEIYLNGEKIHSSLPINEIGAGLTRQCQGRDLLIEVDRFRLNLGENILSFHLVGDTNSANLGLYPGNPLLFDKFSNLVAQNTEYTLIALIAIYLAIGFYHLILSIGRAQSQQDAYFGIFCIFLVVYNVTRSGFIVNYIEDAQILTRLDNAAVFVLVVPFMRFLDLILYAKPTRFSLVFSIFVVLCAVAVSIPGPLRLAESILRTWQIAFLAGLVYFIGVHGRRPIQATFKSIWQEESEATLPNKIFRTISVTLVQTPVGNLLLGVLTLVMTVTWDILDSIFFRTGIGLTKYGFPIFIIGIALMLAKYTQKMHSNIEALNENLERQIKIEINLKDSFARFVPKPFLRILGKNDIPDVNLGDYTEREMTVMFADIRSFTSISEKLTPKQTFEFINSYLKGAGPIIRNHDGFIDKYMGDGIMALFESSEAAIAAAVRLQDRNERISRTLHAKMSIPLKVGIGLHTGHLMLGTIGEHQRMDGTVIADAVNLASRVESLTKQYGADILATDVTLKNQLSRQKQEALRFRFVDRIAVKGKSEPTNIYAVLRPRSSEILALDGLLIDWDNSLKAYYSRNFQDAAVGFEAILATNKNDLPARIFLSRCMDYLKEPPSPEWSGAAIAVTK